MTTRDLWLEDARSRHLARRPSFTGFYVRAPILRMRLLQTGSITVTITVWYRGLHN